MSSTTSDAGCPRCSESVHQLGDVVPWIPGVRIAADDHRPARGKNPAIECARCDAVGIRQHPDRCPFGADPLDRGARPVDAVTVYHENFHAIGGIGPIDQAPHARVDVLTLVVAGDDDAHERGVATHSARPHAAPARNGPCNAEMPSSATPRPGRRRARRDSLVPSACNINGPPSPFPSRPSAIDRSRLRCASKALARSRNASWILQRVGTSWGSTFRPPIHRDNSDDSGASPGSLMGMVCRLALAGTRRLTNRTHVRILGTGDSRREPAAVGRPGPRLAAVVVPRGRGAAPLALPSDVDHGRQGGHDGCR